VEQRLYVESGLHVEPGLHMEQVRPVVVHLAARFVRLDGAGIDRAVGSEPVS